jgi:hypothetical protein
MGVTPALSSIRVRENRIWIGVRNEAERVALEDALLRVGVPPSAVASQIVSMVQPLSLQGEHRPVMAGFQIEYLTNSGAASSCTIGPILRRLGQYGFLVNSHCTRTFGQIVGNDTTHYWQHRRRWYQPTYRHIGNEAIDPPTWACSINMTHGCKYSDAALGLFRPALSGSIARIGQPIGRNSGSTSINPVEPEFVISSVHDWSIDGEILEKVGRTTGWSGGIVTDACADLQLTIGPTILCAVVMEASGGPGDSGSPLFSRVNGAEVELRGTLFGGFGTPERPCAEDLSGLITCPFTTYSNLGGIRLDLDPSGTAPLLFMFQPGDGDGGGGTPGCEPNPFDPANPICPEFIPGGGI